MQVNTESIVKLSRAYKEKLWQAKMASKSGIMLEFLKADKQTYQAMLFLSLETPVELARLFGLSFFELETMINTISYSSFRCRKKGGGHREILAPSALLKRLQRQLNSYLQAYYAKLRPVEVYGFVPAIKSQGKSCNIVQNAAPHIGQRHLLNLDLADFFPTITAKLVYKLFKGEHFQFSDEVAVALSLLTTYRGTLPTGAPTSPVLSNFICLELDAALKKLCRRFGLTYTRYADDLSFSSQTFICKPIIKCIEEVITEHGFWLNPKKTRMAGPGHKHIVTGLVVNEKVNVDRKLLKKLRAIIYHCKREGLFAATSKFYNSANRYDLGQVEVFVRHICGLIAFVGQVKGNDSTSYQALKEGFGNSLNGFREVRQLLLTAKAQYWLRN